MKKYLFGLGAMLIGAGLMFVFTHTEVSADSMSKENIYCQKYLINNLHRFYYEYCKIEDLTCVTSQRGSNGGISCVKTD